MAMNQCERSAAAAFLAESFLAETLSSVEETEYVAHLDSCARCRQRLEATAGRVEAAAPRAAEWADWNDWAEWLRASGGETIALNAPDVGGKEWNTKKSSSLGAAIDLLAPSDDPAMMGRIGTYEIRGVVGQGGNGIVLKAFDPALDRVVAIKVIDPLLAKSGAARQRFAREAKSMASIFHENVVPIHAVDEHQGLPYFVMEYVPGQSLEARIEATGALPITEVIRIGRQVARGLREAHSQGVIHRDVKPGNILLGRGVARVLLTDFGLARVIDDASVTQSGMLAGTPQYMSPEQVRGETVTPSSDLFSLGCVLYAMCAGHSPFRADSVYGAIQRIAHASPRDLRELNAAVPIWLDRFIGKLLAKQPGDRFTSADEVATILNDELAHRQNPTTVPEPKRWWLATAAKRSSLKWNSMPVMVAITVALTLCLSTGLDFPQQDQGASVATSNAPASGTATQTVSGSIGTKSDSPRKSEIHLPNDPSPHVQPSRDAWDRLHPAFEDAAPSVGDPWDMEYARAIKLLRRLQP